MNYKSILKRHISVLLTLIMLMSLFVPAMSVYAENDVVHSRIYVNNNRAATQSNAIICENFIKSVDYDELKAYLIEKFSTCPKSVDISKFNISCDDMDLFIEVMCNNIPELFHVRAADYFSFTYSNSSNTLLTVEPEHYGCTPDEYAVKMQECEKAAHKLLYGIEGNDEMGEAEKAVLIHDRIATYCEYAKAELISGGPVSIFALDGVLLNRRAVCNGYAIAYVYLAGMVGLEAYYCPSDNLDHAWNTVYVDGKLYHIDATWDDPTADRIGQVNHNSVLLSTNKFRSSPSGHAAYDFDARPITTTYDNEYWVNTVSSAFVYIKGIYFYVDSSDGWIKATSTLLDRSDDINLINTYGSYNAVSVSTDGRNLYYNSLTDVFKYDLETGDISVIYHPTNLANDQYIYGSYYDGRYLTLDYAKSVNSVDRRVTVELLNDECAAGDHLLMDTTPGTTTFCFACGETVTLECANHKWTEVIDINPTCGKAGVKHEECSICHAVQNENTLIEATGLHTYGEGVVTAATCAAEGYTKYTCNVCGYIYIDERTEKTVHTWTWVVDSDATCSSNGTMHQECEKCDATQNAGTVIPETDNHKDADGDGVCNSCGKVLIKACGHICHKKGFVGFIWRIVNIFNKLAGTNKTCDCGEAHY